MSTLRITSRVQAFADNVPGTASEPLLSHVDWSRFASGMQAREIISDHRLVDSGDTLSLASVASITGVASGALYSLGVHPSKSWRYQIRYTGGAVTNPLLGLGTGLLTPANTYAVSLNSDASINLSDTSSSPVNFGSSLKRGDKVYIAGSNFGDSGVFSVSNQGFWVVVRYAAVGANPGAMLVLKRVDLTDSTGIAETPTASSALDVQKVAPASTAFIVGSAPYSGVWSIVESASGWISIGSTDFLPDVQGATLTAFTITQEEFLGYMRVEVDGPAIVTSQSGDLAQGNQLVHPVKFSDPLAAPVGGWIESYGFFTSLSVQNIGDGPISVNVVLAYLES